MEGDKPAEAVASEETAPEGFVVRRALPSDLPAASRMAARLVRLHHAFDPLRFMCVDDLERGYERYFRSELASRDVVLLVAERASEIVGYAYGRKEARDWNQLLDAHGALHDIFVDESARGTGLSSALLRATLAALAALGVPRVVLHTAAQNATAQRLFERHGFRRTMVEMTFECPPPKP